MESRLQKHLKNLRQLDAERRHWLRVSGFVVLVVLGIIFEWNHVVQDHLGWLIVSSGLPITVLWWYWTMRIVRHLLESKNDEYHILTDIVFSIKEIKQDIKDTFKPVDKSE